MDYYTLRNRVTGQGPLHHSTFPRGKRVSTGERKERAIDSTVGGRVFLVQFVQVFLLPKGIETVDTGVTEGNLPISNDIPHMTFTYDEGMRTEAYYEPSAIPLERLAPRMGFNLPENRVESGYHGVCHFPDILDAAKPPGMV